MTESLYAAQYTKGDLWEDRPQGYRRLILKDAPGGRVERILLLSRERMLPHFHTCKDEKIVPLRGMGSIQFLGMGGVIQPGSPAITIPRGISHEIKPLKAATFEYLIESTGQLPGKTIWGEAWNTCITYALYPVSDPIGQAYAIPLMNTIARWQKQGDESSDPEQYIARTGQNSNVQIMVIFDGGYAIGAAFIGVAEGYDREKTNAILTHGSFGTQIPKETIWLNYQSWESTTALDSWTLREVWGVFRLACKEAFPRAKCVVARSRHYYVWEHVYCSPWNVLAHIDLRGFRWEAPDGKVFQGYDERFCHYGILALSLE